MTAQFLDLAAAADFLGPGAVEVNRYQSEITDICRRRAPQRILLGKKVSSSEELP